MAPLYRAGMAKSFVSSLGVLLLIAILAVTTRPLTRIPVALFVKHSSLQVEHYRAEDAKKTHWSPFIGWPLIEKRLDPFSYEGRIIKGRQLSCLMRASITEATILNDGNSLEAAVQSSDYFEVEGWKEIIDPRHPFLKTQLDSAFTLLQIDKTNNIVKEHASLAQGQIFGELPDGEIDLDHITFINPTGAHFENIINAQGGAIIADSNESPYSLGFSLNSFESISRIYQWSDAAFLQYQEVCASASVPLQSLRYIFRTTVINRDTQDMVLAALQSQNRNEVPNWDKRVTYTLAANPDQFLAILGSKNGAGCAYLLITHKAQLGVKQITGITFWTSSVTFPIGNDLRLLKLQMYFTVEDVATPT